MLNRVGSLKSLLPVLSLLFFFLFFSLPAQSGQLSVPGIKHSQSENSEQPETEKASTSLIATLSDEQVRKLLIVELQRNTDETQTYSAISHHVPGPGAFFSGLLYYFTQKSDSSEKAVKQLLSSIPEVIPDLNRVFLTL